MQNSRHKYPEWSIAQYENLSKMYNTVKDVYNNNAEEGKPNTEIAVLYPMVNLSANNDFDSLYDTENKIKVDDINIDGHNVVYIKNEYEQMVNQGTEYICVWHNHLQGTWFSTEDIRTLFTLKHLTSLVVDSGNELLVLHKTQETIEKMSKIENTPNYDAAYTGNIADFIVSKFIEYEQRAVNLCVKLFGAYYSDVDSYYAFRELVLNETFRIFEENFSTRYFSIPKHIGSKFLFDT